MARSKEDRALEAAAIVRRHVQSLDKAIVYVTDKVVFDVRDGVRQFRKNYWGVFDRPRDPRTGKKLLWNALTEHVVDQHALRRDLDSKDLGYRALHPDANPDAEIARAATREWVARSNFGQILDDAAKREGIDGTSIWKVTRLKKGVPKVTLVDRLNFYIDPLAESIAKAPRVVERAVMTTEELARMDGWADVKGIEGMEHHPNDADVSNGVPKDSSQVEAYELWGLVPESLFEDGKEGEAEAHIVVSGLDGNPRLHLCERNTKKDRWGDPLRPYEECWADKVPGRWDGRGPAERVLYLQAYANMILNTRVTRNELSQLGLFKVRKGSGLNQQTFQGLAANGVLPVNDMGDIEQLVVQEASQNSYVDEEKAYELARRITGVLEVATGEQLPSSSTATSAAISSTAAQDYFTHAKEQRGLFLQRLFDRHVWPILAEGIGKGFVARFFRDDAKWNELAERAAMRSVERAMEEAGAQGFAPTPMQIEEAIRTARADIEASGTLLVELTREVAKDLDAVMTATNEAMDVGVTVQNLFDLAKVMPEDRAHYAREAADLLGISQPPASPAVNQGMQPGVEGVPAMDPTGGIVPAPDQILAAR